MPASAIALVGNATVDNSSAPVAAGFATLFPSGQTRPTTSNLNFVPGTVRPNEFTVALGSDGTFNLFSSSGGNFLLDITGFYAPPGTGGLFFHPLSAPVRLLDTRAGQSASQAPGHPLAPNQPFSLNASFTFNGITVPSRGARPRGERDGGQLDRECPTRLRHALSGRAAATEHLHAELRAGHGRPERLHRRGGIGRNLQSVEQYRRQFHHRHHRLLRCQRHRRVLLHAARRSRARARYARRSNRLPGAGQPLAAESTFVLAGAFTFNGISVPGGAAALVGNATVDNSANPVPPGFATLFPTGASLPLASNLNFVPGTVAPNAFIVGLGNGWDVQSPEQHRRQLHHRHHRLLLRRAAIEQRGERRDANAANAGCGCGYPGSSSGSPDGHIGWPGATTGWTRRCRSGVIARQPAARTGPHRPPRPRRDHKPAFAAVSAVGGRGAVRFLTAPLPPTDASDGYTVRRFAESQNRAQHRQPSDEKRWTPSLPRVYGHLHSCSDFERMVN